MHRQHDNAGLPPQHCGQHQAPVDFDRDGDPAKAQEGALYSHSQEKTRAQYCHGLQTEEADAQRHQPEIVAAEGVQFLHSYAEVAARHDLLQLDGLGGHHRDERQQAVAAHRDQRQVVALAGCRCHQHGELVVAHRDHLQLAVTGGRRFD